MSGRGKNYTEREKDLLIDCVAPFKNIIECLETNKKSNANKIVAWEKITDAFNGQNNVKRDSKSLVSLYKQMKMNAKKEYATDKVCRTEFSRHLFVPNRFFLLAFTFPNWWRGFFVKC